MAETAISRSPLVRREGARCPVTPVDAVPCAGIKPWIDNRTDMEGVACAVVDPVVTGDRSCRGDIAYCHLETVLLHAVRLILVIVGTHRNSIIAIIGKVMADVQLMLSSVKLRVTGSISPVHRNQMRIRIRITKSDDMAEPGSLHRIIVAADIECRRVVDRRDINRDLDRPDRFSTAVILRNCRKGIQRAVGICGRSPVCLMISINRIVRHSIPWSGRVRIVTDLQHAAAHGLDHECSDSTIDISGIPLCLEVFKAYGHLMILGNRDDRGAQCGKSGRKVCCPETQNGNISALRKRVSGQILDGTA